MNPEPTLTDLDHALATTVTTTRHTLDTATTNRNRIISHLVDTTDLTQTSIRQHTGLPRRTIDSIMRKTRGATTESETVRGLLTDALPR